MISSAVCVLFLACGVLFLIYLPFNGGFGDGNKPLNFTVANNCSDSILHLEIWDVNVCIIANSVYVRICANNYYLKNCILLDVLDYTIFCARVKPYLITAQSVVDGGR
jgi:hypothetical protein